ncbi:MAG: hypothetical protein QM532_00645 [Cyanobium sp. MAG06]|nr:hypothetical protein [Cyanobium sp. MAG06]
MPGDEDDNNLDNKIHLLNNSKNKNDNITETVKVLTQKELE